MKKVFKKFGIIIIKVFSFIIAGLISIATILFFLNNKQEKKKKKIIDKNKSVIEKSKKQELKHEKAISNSNNIYNSLTSGKFRRNPKTTKKSNK